MTEHALSAAPQAAETRVPAISFAEVSKHFTRADGGSLEVLRRVSFDVPNGMVVALIGPSGSGKSTLLHMAAGLLAPDSGEVTVMGRRTDASVEWEKVGYMFQDDRLLPWRGALKNVALALESGTTPKTERRERARAALDLVGLSEFADAFPHQLSGGMRSRVALARSLVGRPDILLMDEPFSRLDAQTRDTMHRELLRIQTMRHMSILFVTHDVEEAVILADHIVVLAPRPGRVRRRVDVELAQPRLGSEAAAALVNELRASLGEAESTREGS
jgi:ABC-type nitrate/sulfonate/bicarbonate transport system ATPase subunit